MSKCKCGSTWMVVCHQCHEYTQTWKWISVKERLPEHCEACLFITKNETGPEANSGYYDELNEEWNCNASGFLPPDEYQKCVQFLRFKTADISFWMPLPHPPEN